MYEKHKEIAEGLIFPMWLCVKEEFKTSNSMDIWRFFENFIRTCANNEDLSKLFGQFKRICPFDMRRGKVEKAILDFILNKDNENVIELLQGDDLPLIIMFTRELNKQRKNKFEL